MRAVVTARCEDHVSPALRALSRSMRTIPVDAELPPLPDTAVVVEREQRGGNVGVKLSPSPDLTAWIADVQRLAAP